MNPSVQKGDSESTVLRDYDADSDTLLVAFGGWKGAFGIAPFEFFNLTDAYPTKRLFVRDLNQTWYQGQFPGVGGGPLVLADYLKKEIEEVAPARTVFVGNCSGAYAAILMGWLVRPDHVLAFSPIAYFNFGLRLRHRDFRAEKMARSGRRQPTALKEAFDLTTYPLGREQGGPSIEVHVGRRSRVDMTHASRLEPLPNVSVHEHDYDRHDLVRYMRDQGTLGDILLGALRPDEAAAPGVEPSPAASR